jgi:hypothetical protein
MFRADGALAILDHVPSFLIESCLPREPDAAPIEQLGAWPQLCFGFTPTTLQRRTWSNTARPRSD